MKAYIILPLLFVLFTASACSKIVNTHGQIVSQARIEALQPNLHSKRDVMRILGSPSTTSTFDGNTWIYLTETTVSRPLSPNQLAQRDLLVLKFNDDDILTEVIQKDETSGKVITPSSRATKTQGESLGVIDQIINNVGANK